MILLAAIVAIGTAGLGSAAAIVDLDAPLKIKKLPVFPTPAISDNVSGRVSVQLVIAPDGSVLDCKLVASSGLWLLDSASCENIKSTARFVGVRENTNRRFVVNFKWGLEGGGNVAGIAAILKGRTPNLSDDDPVLPALLTAECVEHGDVKWCNASPPESSAQFDIGSKGTLKFALDRTSSRLMGYELDLDAGIAWQITSRIVYYHGVPCYSDPASGRMGWVAGRFYLVKVGGRVIAGRPGLAPELDMVRATCPPLAPRP